MFAQERQEKIYDMIQKSGAVTTALLMKTFDVSIETVRRDLLSMENQGRLTRVHGGAVAKSDMKTYLDLNRRNKEHESYKDELSQKAAELVENGDIIAIDSGSTAISFAEALKDRFTNLTVVTHCLDVFKILCNHKEFKLILCGGHFLKRENAFYGELAMDTINRLHVRKAFIFPSAVSLEGGICDFQEELFQIQSRLIKRADEVFILADSSKFEKRALLKLDDMKKEYTYVTDSNLSFELSKLYMENDIKIYSNRETEQ